MFEERYAELARQIKHEAETTATAQKPKMNEYSTMLEQAEGGVVAEVAAAHHLNEDANATAACNPGEDANAAATKEKAKNTGDMPRSQNNKNDKISEGDDEIRRLIEERRNTAKGDRQTPTERIEQEDQKEHQVQKKNKKTRKDSEASKV